MSEKQMNPEGTQPENTGKKPEEGRKESKKENWFKRKIIKPIKKFGHEHPGWTAFVSAASGAGLTYGVERAGRAYLNRKQRECYIPQENNNVSPLDPNV